MTVKVGQYIVYALGGVNRLVYSRVTNVDQGGGLVDIELRSNNRITLSVSNNSSRIQVLPNSLVPAAQHAISSDDIEQVLAVLETILDVGVTVASAAAPGLFGGAALMSGLAAIGGTAVGGILVVAGTPAALAGNTLRKIIERNENHTSTNDAAVVGMIAGGIVGSTTAVGSVAAAGSVVGLSGAGITSGLAALGGGSLAASGFGMVGGLIACTGIVTVPVLAVGLSFWGIARAVNEECTQQEYQKFRQKWRNAGYLGPS
ncbi:hypothetical protein TWF281_009671 [Arthrobotrys megalospora]